MIYVSDEGMLSLHYVMQNEVVSVNHPPIQLADDDHWVTVRLVRSAVRGSSSAAMGPS